MVMELEEIADALMSNHIPELTLLIGGMLAVLIAFYYLKRKDSSYYKPLMFVGMLFGIYMAIVAFNTYGVTHWYLSTCIIMAVASFTLIIRPFKEVHFAVLIALLVMCIVYILLGGLEGTALDILASGWPRIGLAVFCGIMVYSLLHMVESIVKVMGKILNAWPVLLILGLVCIAEAVMVLMDYGSVYDFVQTKFLN